MTPTARVKSRAHFLEVLSWSDWVVHLGRDKRKWGGQALRVTALSVGVPRAEDSDGEAEREVADCGIRVVRKEINAVVSRCPAQVMPTPNHSSLRHDVALGTG